MLDIIDTILKIILAILALIGGVELIGKIVFHFHKKEQNSYVAGSSGETIGRDKIIINHFTLPGIGDPEKLLSESSVPPNVSPEVKDTDLISDSLSILVKVDNSFALKSTEVEEIIVFFQSVFDNNSNGRTSQSLMRGAFFALISENQGNLEWEEHCASSLREFFHEWKGSAGAISSAFNEVKKGGANNFPNMSNNRELYERKRIYYEYFSAKCHHEHDNAVRHLRSLHSNQKLKQDSPELFKKTVTMFLTEMNDFIRLTKT